MIRPARPEDAAGIAAIWNPIIRDTAITFTTAEKTLPALEAMIRERQAAGQGFLVAEMEGVAGFATYGAFRNGPGYARSAEHTVLLAPRARGQGVGRALMDQLLAHAARSGIHAMMAGVSAENPEGAAFHERLGFALIARIPQVGHKFGRYMDLLLYQKILS